jgi:hypothetical protein
MEKYISFKHYPLRLADRDQYQNQDKRFKVTTINWTYATENGKQNKFMVHKNEYEIVLPELVQWIRDTETVAEDIIDIEPMEEAGGRWGKGSAQIAK